MAIFRRRPEQIRGIAGSLEDMTVFVADGTVGAGPGIIRVIAAAGAQVTFSGTDNTAVALTLRSVENSFHEVHGIAGAGAAVESNRLATTARRSVDALVLNTAETSTHAAGSEVNDAGNAGFSIPNAIFLARAVTGEMCDSGRTGSVVFITGIDRPGPAARAAALLQMEMEELARTLAPNGIRVNAVAPGQVAVNRRGHVVSSSIAPLGHTSIHPVAVGKAVWYLINSDLSGAITGTTLTVDRGASLLRPEW